MSQPTETLSAPPARRVRPTAQSVGLTDALGDWAGIAGALWQARFGWPDAARQLAYELRTRTLTRGEALDTARADLLLVAIEQYDKSGLPGDRSFAGELAELFAQGGDALWSARAAAVEARQHQLAGRADRAEAGYCAWLAAPDGFEDACDAAWVRTCLAGVLIDSGRDADGFRAYYQALAEHERLGDTPERALTLMNTAVSHIRCGNFHTAEALLEQAWTVARALEAEDLFAIIASNIGRCALRQNEPERALERLQALAGSHGLRMGRGYLELTMADIHGHLDDAAAARAWFDRAEASFASLRVPQVDAARRIVEIAVLRLEGRLDAALAALGAAQRTEPGFATHLYALDLHEAAAALHAQRGDWNLAYEHERRHHERFVELQGMAARAEYLSLQARYELYRAEAERDFERRKREEAEAARSTVERLNHQLSDRLQEIEALQQSLQEQVIRDPLTGLHNRRFLKEALPRELARVRRDGGHFALALLDLDRFKVLNDTYGHAAGDMVLRQVAGILMGQTRSSDVCCRFGGEEFCLVLGGAGGSQAVERVEAMLSGFRQAVVRLDDGRSLSGLSFSAGIAEYPTDAGDADRLIAAADAALYRAKAEGRDRVVRATQDAR